jgi:general secretion pathway protein M
MNDYLKKLSAREWLLLLGGLSILLFSGLYAFVYMPIIDEQKKLNIAIANQQQIQVFLASLSTEVTRLRQNQTEQPIEDTGQSAISLIDASSSQLGVKACIKRVAPEDANNHNVWLEKCSFDKLVYWLAVLQKKHGLTVKQIQLNRETIGGLVSGKVLLSR